MKILVPIDGSSYSRGTLAFLASRKTLLAENPEIELINVQPELPARAALLMSKEALEGYYADESHAAIKDSEVPAELAGALRRSLVGLPAEVIANEAAKDAQLIVMGSRGVSDVSELLFGSVTMGVLARTKVPLLILRNSPTPPDTGLKVGFCIDGSEECRAAVKYAVEHLGLFGTKPEFHLLHAAPTVISTDPDIAERSQRKDFDDCADLVRPLFAATGIAPQEAILTGTPGDAIARYAHEKNLGLIVMGSRGYGRLRSLLLGSTAIRIASKSQVPLLIVR